jgi:hypothetical protein
MTTLGYAQIVDRLRLPVRPLAKPAQLSFAVNRKVEAADRVLFPSGVAVDDTLIGHLEFALRHEGVNLEVIDAALGHINPGDFIDRLRQSPNGEYIRRACFLWEWLSGKHLEPGVTVKGRYVDLVSPEDYCVAAHPTKNAQYRIYNNLLGNPDFCPMVHRAAIPSGPSLEELLAKAGELVRSDPDGGELYERAIHYLYLSETRSSFHIERETPSARKEERFVQLLRHAGEPVDISEDWLVSLQNAVVRDVYSQEASYRHRQNWLENSAGRITFFPPAPGDLARLMAGWERFVNDRERGVDLLVKVACASFGFVYLHPFMDGNGRLHRFLIHHVLAQSGALPDHLAIPVSAVIKNNIPAYHAVLTGFSRPVTELWDYRRAHAGEPQILASPGRHPYSFFEADREVDFLYDMVKLAVEQEIPREMAYLRGYDEAFETLDHELDIPQKDLSNLIRMAHDQGGSLSKNRRKQYGYLPAEVLARIEEVVSEAFSQLRR